MLHNVVNYVYKGSDLSLKHEGGKIMSSIRNIQRTIIANRTGLPRSKAFTLRSLIHERATLKEQYSNASRKDRKQLQKQLDSVNYEIKQLKSKRK